MCWGFDIYRILDAGCMDAEYWFGRDLHNFVNIIS